jgi:hypothetical protein
MENSSFVCSTLLGRIAGQKEVENVVGDAVHLSVIAVAEETKTSLLAAYLMDCSMRQKWVYEQQFERGSLDFLATY